MSNLIFSNSTGRVCNIKPFSSDLGIENNVPIVDRAFACDCLCTGEVYFLVIRNSLYVPSTDHKLTLPFIMRSGSVSINDVPKIFFDCLIVDDNSISFESYDLWIPSKINSLF